jgi:hypothetical protein
MAAWYEVYDDQDALLDARRRVQRLTRAYGLATLALAVGAPLAVLHLPQGPWLAAGAALGLLGGGLYLLHALRTLHAVTWCIRLSFHGFVADFGQRRTAMRWSNVARVEVDDEGLLVVGTDEGGAALRLRLPSSFPRYAQLSHRLVEYAEAHRRPIFVDGRPWQLLDLQVLYPFLGDAVSEA